MKLGPTFVKDFYDVDEMVHNSIFFLMKLVRLLSKTSMMFLPIKHPYLKTEEAQATPDEETDTVKVSGWCLVEFNWEIRLVRVDANTGSNELYHAVRKNCVNNNNKIAQDKAVLFVHRSGMFCRTLLKSHVGRWLFSNVLPHFMIEVFSTSFITISAEK